MMKAYCLQAVELSALRENELVPLLNDLDSLDLDQYSYISIHAPSEFSAAQEPTIRDLLKGQLRRGWPIVMHPDAIHNFAMWRDFGPLLAIENMDKRKPIGRTASQLALIFEKLPDATFCFDIGHARQVDPTMTESYLILRQFGHRLRQVHVSEVNTRSKHDVLSYASILAFQEVADLIPIEIPLILETPLTQSQIQSEIEKADLALPMEQRVAVV